MGSWGWDCSLASDLRNLKPFSLLSNMNISQSTREAISDRTCSMRFPEMQLQLVSSAEGPGGTRQHMWWHHCSHQLTWCSMTSAAHIFMKWYQSCSMFATNAHQLMWWYKNCSSNEVSHEQIRDQKKTLKVKEYEADAGKYVFKMWWSSAGNSQKNIKLVYALGIQVIFVLDLILNSYSRVR